jgi:hypothetical protein
VGDFPLGRGVGISDDSRLHSNLPKTQIDLTRSMSALACWQQVTSHHGRIPPHWRRTGIEEIWSWEQCSSGPAALDACGKLPRRKNRRLRQHPRHNSKRRGRCGVAFSNKRATFGVVTSPSQYSPWNSCVRCRLVQHPSGPPRQSTAFGVGLPPPASSCPAGKQPQSTQSRWEKSANR